MTIEIADRLVKLRKKNGYSQEELADKLGLSRQAVSKWERAEASPDTDNLICLAKLYGVSLDELLSTDEDIDTIVDEQVKDKEKSEEPKAEEKNEDSIVINDKGVFIKDKDGSGISISSKGIYKTGKDGVVVKKEFDRVMTVIGCVEGLLFILAVVAYVLLGSLLGLWGSAWVFIFLPEVLVSIARAIRKKNAQMFNITFLAAFTFFFISMFLPALNPEMPALWHPMWIVFLAIPVYHTAVGTIEAALGKKDPCCCDAIDGDVEIKDADDDDDKDEDDD